SLRGPHPQPAIPRANAKRRINGQIRVLLQIFERSCYVGYTATPFANIFIDPDTNDEMLGQDLFPRSFIVSLDAPSNYFGPKTVFLERPTEYVRSINDNEDHLPLIHDKETSITSLPPSLIEALRVFIVGKAIRLARGQSHEHCSMLVNASRFVNVQRQLRDELHTQLESIRASLRINGTQIPETAMLDAEIQSLHRGWKDEFDSVEPSWPLVLTHLYEAAAPVRVVEVNGRSPGTLNYQDYIEDGLNVVAVGGYSLSRGLTLEGLMISYFLRNSMMYDTLMQMGRWFGYRPDYQDLCRIWMPEEAQGWYEHITESAEELRDEIRSMEAVGATPEEFGLKIRSHPDALIVTARNKMGTSSRVVVNIGLADKLIETHMLSRDADSLASNRATAARFARNIAAQGHKPSLSDGDGFGWLAKGVPAVAIVDFLTEFRNHPGALLTGSGPIKRYIEERQDDELADWDVLFSSVGTRSDVVTDDSLGFLIRCQRRTEGKLSDSKTLLVSNRQRVSTRGIEKTGLSFAQKAAAELGYRAHLEKEGRPVNGTTPNYPDWAYRAQRTSPLLVLHLLAIQDPQGESIRSDPVVAWSISFPPTRLKEKHVEFVVNTTWLREHYGDDLEEEEMLGDDV
ncbi:MAG: endonuclease, partial [Acidimicrobiales bacterium]|nr:endonuclease [Acidimicrobiales bacterium]MYG87744.1 endonuclease [Acidimicrobiales bacterium]MYI29027.1 endonuclease [Acidimicrobiales bacterium]